MRPLEPLSASLEGTQLIEASAGTGKTHTLTTLFLRLLLETELGVERLLVVTFTNAAAAELKARLRARTRQALAAFSRASTSSGAATRSGTAPRDPEIEALVRRSRDPARDAARLGTSLKNFDDAAILTIHAFCQRVLSEHAFETGVLFDLELVADTRSLLAEIAGDVWTSELFCAEPSQLQHLEQRKFDFSSFLKLARMVTDWPEMPIEPAPAEHTNAALERYLAARAAARDAWRRDRERVQKLLVSSTALTRRSYDPEKIPEWCEALGELLEETEPSLKGFFHHFDRFTTAGIERGKRRAAIAPTDPFFSRCDALWEAREALEAELDSWMLSFLSRIVERARQTLPERKQSLGIAGFEDLLRYVDRALSVPGGERLALRLRRRYPAALIDEFQDTDPLQYRIFRRLFHESGSASQREAFDESDPITRDGRLSNTRPRLLFIGDPKQAIYAFRGADIFAYIQAAKDAPERLTLSTNYRSDPSLLSALNTLFQNAPDAFLFESIRYTPVAPRPNAEDCLLGPDGAPLCPFEVLYVPRTDNRRGLPRERIAPAIAGDIAALLRGPARLCGRPVEPGDVAVLTRRNSEARDIAQALRELGIPTVVHGDASVFEADEAKELAVLLRAMMEPSNVRAVATALSTELLGHDASQLATLVQEENAWERWVDDFHRWHEIWVQRGFVQAIEQLLADSGVQQRLLRRLDGERRLTNLLHLIELVHRASVERHLGMTGLSQWFNDAQLKTAARDGMAPEAQQIRLESDLKAVQLTTMHRSKGLEYNVVYCPYLFEGSTLFPDEQRFIKYHDERADYAFKLRFGIGAEEPARELELAKHEARAEHMRLCYVALTRARHRVVVLWGAYPYSAESPLARLFYGKRAAQRAASLQQYFAERSDATLRQELVTLGAEASNSLRVRDLSFEPGFDYQGARPSVTELVARSRRRALDRGFRSSSFSALVAPSAPNASFHGERDLDETSEGGLSAQERARSVSDQQHAVLLSDFPRGARAGELVHAVLEELDFENATVEAIRPLVGAAIERFGFEDRWSDTLSEALADVLHTNLPADPAFSLSALPRKKRVSELSFTLSVSQPANGSSPARGLAAPDLARVLATHAQTALVRTYAAELKRVSFLPLSGFLRGFIDLVFEHNERFYLVDYKSNHLGSKVRDYVPAALEESMLHHHYVLQYHLYAVALHRHLAQRGPGYDPERHFGGVFYLFLRGMSREHAPGHGVFFDRPPVALLDELSLLLETGPMRSAGPTGGPS